MIKKRKFCCGELVQVYFFEWRAVYTGEIIGFVGEGLVECVGQDERARPARFVAPKSSVYLR